MILGCSELFKMGITQCHCCPSCHEDMQEHGEDMFEGKLINDQEYHVCCSTLGWLKRNGFILERVYE